MELETYNEQLSALVLKLLHFWSYYKINNEKIAIKSEGITVNNEKKTIYFLLAIEPLTLIFDLIEFEISMNINVKKNNRKKTSQN